MKRKYLLLISILTILILQSNTCKKENAECSANSHLGLIISNQSSRNIRYHIYWNYPDTAIGDYNPVFDGSDGLSPDEQFTRGASRNSCWESVFKDGKKEWIYFFDKDSLDAVPWDTVKKTGRGLLERRLVDLNYLNAHDWILTYP